MDNKVNWLSELYEGYLANSDGLAWDGRPCPTWGELNDKVRSHWCATVITARALAADGRL